MAAKPLRLATGFEEEVHEAARYYDAQRSGLGDEFVDTVDALLAEILRAPRSFPPAGEATDAFPLRQALTRRFRYKVIYWELPDEVFVLACAHQHRRPGYWRSRLPDA